MEKSLFAESLWSHYISATSMRETFFHHIIFCGSIEFASKWTLSALTRNLNTSLPHPLSDIVCGVENSATKSRLEFATGIERVERLKK